jgi:hypothetical protein
MMLRLRITYSASMHASGLPPGEWLIWAVSGPWTKSFMMVRALTELPALLVGSWTVIRDGQGSY